jgi:hypothetical protein
LARLRRLIDEKRSGEEEILSYDKNGDEVWLSANVRAFHDDRGRVRYICALLTDITETRQLRSLHSQLAKNLAGTNGWLPSAALTRLAPMSSPKTADWVGTWCDPGCSIEIKAGEGGKLQIEAFRGASAAARFS